MDIARRKATGPRNKAARPRQIAVQQGVVNKRRRTGRPGPVVKSRCDPSFVRRRGGESPAVRCRRHQTGILHLDRAVGTLLRAAFAADAPIADEDFLVVTALNRVHRATDHAHRIETGPASGWHEILGLARPNQKETAIAIIVRIDAGAHAFVAARAAVEVDQHQLLAFDQAKLLAARGMDQCPVNVRMGEGFQIRLTTREADQPCGAPRPMPSGAYSALGGAGASHRLPLCRCDKAAPGPLRASGRFSGGYK